jgi:hypothetical protein
MENAHSPLARQAQKLDVVENIRRLRGRTPRGHRGGFARHHLRMRLPVVIFHLDDSREVLLDRRFRPLLERTRGEAVAAPACIKRDELWSRKRGESHYLYDAFSHDEAEQLARAEAALRYFGISPPVDPGGHDG